MENREQQLERMRKVQAARICELEAIKHAAKVRECVTAFAKLANAKTGARIDSENKRASVRTEVSVTREVQANRATLHDAAQTNPILRKILIQMQKADTL